MQANTDDHVTILRKALAEGELRKRVTSGERWTVAEQAMEDVVSVPRALLEWAQQNIDCQEDSAEREKVSAALGHYLTGQDDTSDNAPWLTLAHVICFEAGVPSGHITDRLAKLRDILDDYRWRPAGKAVIEILRRAMDQAEVTGLQRAYLGCCFTNEWNSAWPAKEEDGPVVGNLRIPKELP